jgi:hypothetical protein
MKGYAGEACRESGSFTMMRNWTCSKCDACGSSRDHKGGGICLPVLKKRSSVVENLPRIIVYAIRAS